MVKIGEYFLFFILEGTMPVAISSASSDLGHNVFKTHLLILGVVSELVNWPSEVRIFELKWESGDHFVSDSICYGVLWMQYQEPGCTESSNLNTYVKYKQMKCTSIGKTPWNMFYSMLHIQFIFRNRCNCYSTSTVRDTWCDGEGCICIETLKRSSPRCVSFSTGNH